ncbi:MAG: hypothetical protein WCA45_12535 [Thiobacillaceae bacterium]
MVGDDDYKGLQQPSGGYGAAAGGDGAGYGDSQTPPSSYAGADGTTYATLTKAAGGGGGGGTSAADVVAPFPDLIAIGLGPSDPALAKCIDAASQVASVTGLCTGVIDLTGISGTPSALPYVGHNDTERLYVGSIAKIYPLLAAFELRRRVTDQAKSMIANGLDATKAGWQKKVFDTILAAWQPQLDAKFPGLPTGHPNFDAILQLATDGTASFKTTFTNWITQATQHNDEAAAGNYIRALSYPYINGVLDAAGFFDSTADSGLWISGDYNVHDWKPGDKAGKPIDTRWQKPGHAVSNFVGTATQLTRYVGLLATGNLVPSVPASEMIDLLGWPWLHDILTKASKLFTSTDGKVGIGEWDLRDHDAAIMTWVRDSHDATRTIRYVVVVLGSDRANTQMRRLELAYHDCIVAQHP